MADTILGGDFTVFYAADNNRKGIRWTGPIKGTRTLNEFYSALLKLFDDLTQMDDKIPIAAVTPDIYRMTNGWFIDDSSVEHLIGGSIFSGDWTNNVRIIGADFATAFSDDDIGRTIIGGTTGDTGTILDYNSARGLVWIRPDVIAGDLFDDPDEAYSIDPDTAGLVLNVSDPSGSPVWLDESTGFHDATDANYDVFPASEATGDYACWGSAQKFSKLTFDNANGTAGTVGVGAWEYWDGSAWADLETGAFADGTSDFTAAVSDGQDVTWDAPSDWATTSLDGSAQLYFIRFRITTVYTVNPVYDQGFIGGQGAGVFQAHARHGAASVTGESSWAGITSIGAIQDNTKAYIYQEDPDTPAGGFKEEKVLETKGTDSWWPQEGHLNMCLKTKEADSVFGPNPDAATTGIGTFFMRQYSKLYSHFIGTSLSTTGGNTVVPFGTGDDLDNTSGHRQFVTDAETGGGWGSGDVDTVMRIQTNNATLQAWQVDDTPADTAFVDQTTGFNDATDANLTPFPATEAAGDYFAIGFDQPFNTLVFDNLNGTQGVGGTVDWEYWNGTAWTTVSGLSDGTTGFTNAVADGSVVTWTLPTDWERMAINGSQVMYFVRASVTGTYSTNPVYDQGFVRFTTNQAVITSVTGTGPTYTVQYYLIQDQTDFANDDVMEDEASSKSMTINGAPTDVNPAAAPDSSVTITFDGITRDINNGAGLRPYSIEIDPTGSNVPVADIYEVLKYRTRHGSTTQLLGQNGEEYVGNELQVEYSAQAGGNFVEGTKVYDQTTNAEGILVGDHDDGTSGDVILKAVRGTFTTGNVLSDSPSPSQSLGQVWAFTSPSTWLDETTDAGSAGGADVPVPNAVGDILYIGAAEPFAQADIDISTAAGGSHVGLWEYWNGSSWTSLEAVTGFTDSTSDLTGGTGFLEVSYGPPLDWQALSVNDSAVLYYIRHRVTTSDTAATVQEIQILDLVTATIDSTRTIVPVQAAPFGTLAGGSLFGAPGVVLVTGNLATGEEQAYQLIDDDGTTQIPPNTISITVDNLISGDSVAVFRRTGSDVNKTQFTLAAANDLGDVAIEVNENIDSDNPTNAHSKIRLISSGGEEHRYRYNSYDSGTDIFTLETASTGTDDGTGTLTTIDDAASTFQTDGVEVGDMVRNTTDGVSYSVVVSVDSETLLTVTDNGQTWASQAFSVNTLVENYPTNNNAYVPLIERVADATSESNQLVFSSAFDIKAVVRRSSTATEILPFEQDTSLSGNTTVTAIRNNDDIIGS